MTYLPAWLRTLVEKRALGRCEYCQAHKRIVMSLEVDHVLPLTAGGVSDIDNLCLACRGCNGFKRAFISGPDPETGQVTRLYNPHTDVWIEHFRWMHGGTRIHGLTAVGRATIRRLKMNRADAVSARVVGGGKVASACGQSLDAISA